ncbi:transposase [bacterium]|nr:transposase [bacterium]
MIEPGSAQSGPVYKIPLSRPNRFQPEIHGYCWMPNHVHLMIEVDQTPLSKIIQNLSLRIYASLTPV